MPSLRAVDTRKYPFKGALYLQHIIRLLRVIKVLQVLIHQVLFPAKRTNCDDTRSCFREQSIQGRLGLQFKVSHLTGSAKVEFLDHVDTQNAEWNDRLDLTHCPV